MPAVSLIIKFNQETNVLYIILIAAFRLNTCLVHLHVPTDHLSVTYLFIFKFYSVTCARTADKEHAVSLQKHCIQPWASILSGRGKHFYRVEFFLKF